MGRYLYLYLFIPLILLIIIYKFNSPVKVHKLYVDESSIKYQINNNDNIFLTKNAKEIDTLPEKTHGIFYTTTPWNSTTHNNYCKYKERYYIVEPGYYYVVNSDTEYFIEYAKLFMYFFEK
jgi:hypothetical protein